MEKDKIFFGENGLTSTSANYISNICKEAYRKMETSLNNIVFYTTTIKLLGSSEESLLKEGVKTVSDVKDTLDKIAKLKSLIAWLREAIKAKERLIKEANISSYEDYNIEIPEAPVLKLAITADNVIATWNIKKRNRYYYLETLCATIGQYIHPDGVFSTERDHLLKVLSEPHSVEGNGRDTILYTHKPSLPVEEVEDTFMELQNIYRGYQSELNSMKHEIETTCNNDSIAKSAAFQTAMQEYKNIMKVKDAELVARKQVAVKEASDLKIIIPDSLKPVYDMVQKLGK